MLNWLGDRIFVDHIGALPEKLEDCLRLDDPPPGLCADVWTRLSSAILDEIKRIGSIDALDKEIDDHVKFGKDRARLLVVFLDALDQLSDADHARNLIWLPSERPDHVRLVVLTASGEPGTPSNEYKAALERKLPSGLVMLEPMPREEADELLEAWLTEADSTLQLPTEE